MSLDPLTSAKTLSSQLGRQWLEAADGFSSLDANRNEENSRAFVVTIPYVGSSGCDSIAGIEPVESLNSEAIALALSVATENKLNELRSAVIDELAADRQSVENREAFASQTEPEVSFDLSEKPQDWTEQTDSKEAERSGASKTSTSGSQNEAIETLVDAILKRFPLGDPTVLQFVGSEPNIHVDETCARVGSALAERKVGRVLLLDSDSTGQALSKASGVSGEPGISDVVNQDASWESVIYGRSATGLDFMGAGNEPFSHPQGKTRLRNALAEMKREYQFVCISAGDAHSSAASMWNDICDGSYLLVSLKNSNESRAKSAVAELQSSGARLLGCIVTDID